jgi:hypothetical protein
VPDRADPTVGRGRANSELTDAATDCVFLPLAETQWDMPISLFIATKGNKKEKSIDQNDQCFFDLKLFRAGAYSVPRLACSASIDSNKALKLPLPKDCAPLRWIISKNIVGRSKTGLVKI